MTGSAYEKKILAEPVRIIPEPPSRPLHTCVQQALDSYFQQLADATPHDLYALVMSEIEPPLLEAVLRYTAGNQSRAAEVLGINRGTLRKKLKTYGIG
jgi:Fis family transcriptional regulator